MNAVPYLILLLVISTLFVFRKTAILTFQLKFAVYYGYLSIMSLLSIPLFLLTPKDVANSRRASYVNRLAAKFIGIEYELRNEEVLAKDRGAFIVANHQSSLDMLGLWSIWEVPFKVAVIAKKEILYMGPFGLSSWLAGAIFIDRSSPKNAYETMKHATKLVTSESTKLWAFPEGTRHKEANEKRTMLPFKKGVFKMAVACQAPIIPVVFSPYYFLNAKTNYFGQGKIIIEALPEIETKGLTESDVDDLVNKCHGIMQQAYEQLFKQVEDTLPATHPFLVK